MTPNQHELVIKIMDDMERLYPDLYTQIQNAPSAEFVFQDCGKVKYGHKETAETAAVAMNLKTGDSYDTYQCVRCSDAWHIGHSKNEQERQETTYDIAPFTLNSNLRYRVVAVDGDAARLLSGPCPCYWLDRATNQPLTYKDGSEARWSSLDEAIEAFVEGRLSVERNEVMG